MEDRGWSRGSGVMDNEIDIDLPNRIEFRVNHKKRLIESSDPSIYMRDRGGIPEPELKFFSLHWEGREIPARTRMKYKGFGRNTDGQNEYEVDWIVESIGKRDYAAVAAGAPYKFTSREELICAANLITKALQVYGGRFDRPDWNSFPVARRISARLSEALSWKFTGARASPLVRIYSSKGVRVSDVCDEVWRCTRACLATVSIGSHDHVSEAIRQSADKVFFS